MDERARDEVRVRLAPELGGLELLEAVHRRPRFPRHAHPTFAVGAVGWGVNRFRCRGADHAAGPGALCTVIPGEVHEVEPAPGGGFAYRCLYPTVELVGRAVEAASGRTPRGALALPPVIEDPVAARLLAAVFDAESSGAPLLEREARLAALLARVVLRHARPAPAPRSAPLARGAALARARDFLAAHLAENVSLERLAAVADLEPFALLRGFAAAHGLPPHAWLVQERVRRAQALLRAGLAPGDVAGQVGFADQSHLTRHFRRLLGITPGRYRQAALEASRAAR